MAPFPEDTEYFGEAGKVRMINFRVRDLDAPTAPRLRSTRKSIPTAVSLDRMIRRGIRLVCGSLPAATIPLPLPDSRGSVTNQVLLNRDREGVARDAGDNRLTRVDGFLEIAQQPDRLRIHKREELHHDHGAERSPRIDPVERVLHARPG
jgi:hypothetical protein